MKTQLRIERVCASEGFPFLCRICEEVHEDWDYLRIYLGDSIGGRCVHICCLPPWLRQMLDLEDDERETLLPRLPKIIKTEKDVVEVAKFIMGQLKKAHAAGVEGITVESTPEIPIFKLTLEEAIHKAERFLEDLAGARCYRLINTEERGNIWKLRYDVGILRKQIVEMVVDDKTGQIESYEVVPAPGKTPS